MRRTPPLKKKWSSIARRSGLSGLETELGLFIDILLHKRKAISINRLIEMFTVEPAKLLKIDAGTLSIGAKADITLIDPEIGMDGGRDEVRIALAQHAVSTAGN